MGQHRDGQDIITLEEMTDPFNGQIIFGVPDTILPARRTSSALTMTGEGLVDEERPSQQPLTLPTDRFAGDAPPDWSAAEAQQAGGLVVSMVDGKLVTSQDNGPAQQVELPRDRFAASDRFREENIEVVSLARAGAGSVVKLLKHSSQFPSWPATSPAGWVYTTRPTSHGDELTVLLAHNLTTGMYHAHFWRFDVRGVDGRMGAVDLPKYMHAHPNLTAHGTHMYPDGRGGAVLCLSTNTRGGLQSLTAAVFQAAKWADGMGEVVRGRHFPYRE